jgi:hypothetical protein
MEACSPPAQQQRANGALEKLVQSARESEQL